MTSNPAVERDCRKLRLWCSSLPRRAAQPYLWGLFNA